MVELMWRVACMSTFILYKLRSYQRTLTTQILMIIWFQSQLTAGIVSSHAVAFYTHSLRSKFQHQFGIVYLHLWGYSSISWSEPLYHVRIELSLINIFRWWLSGMFHPCETGCNGHVPVHGNYNMVRLTSHAYKFKCECSKGTKCRLAQENVLAR